MSVAGQALGIGHGQVPGESKGLVAMGRLIAGLSSLDGVTKLGLASGSGHVDLWVLLRDEDDVTEGEVSRLEREYLATMGPVSFDLHVVPLTAADEANLPPFETILQR
jgi:hypothetical protein